MKQQQKKMLMSQHFGNNGYSPSLSEYRAMALRRCGRNLKGDVAENF